MSTGKDAYGTGRERGSISEDQNISRRGYQTCPEGRVCWSDGLVPLGILYLPLERVALDPEASFLVDFEHSLVLRVDFCDNLVHAL